MSIDTSGIKQVFTECKTYYIIIAAVVAIPAIILVLMGTGSFSSSYTGKPDKSGISYKLKWKFLVPGIIFGIIAIVFLILYLISMMSKKCRKAKSQYTHGDI